MRKPVLISVLMLLVMSCKENDSETGSFFQVERIATHPGVQFPLDEIPDSLYVVSTENLRYTIRFSDERDSVFIDQERITGYRTAQSESSITYATDQFAGGRFVVKTNMMPNEAELVTYGSGTPVVKGEKGIIRTR